LICCDIFWSVFVYVHFWTILKISLFRSCKLLKYFIHIYSENVKFIYISSSQTEPKKMNNCQQQEPVERWSPRTVQEATRFAQTNGLHRQRYVYIKLQVSFIQREVEIYRWNKGRFCSFVQYFSQCRARTVSTCERRVDEENTSDDDNDAMV